MDELVSLPNVICSKGGITYGLMANYVDAVLSPERWSTYPMVNMNRLADHIRGCDSCRLTYDEIIEGLRKTWGIPEDRIM
jgi:hypothetical protein